MTAPPTAPAKLRALQTAIQQAGDEQIVRIVDLVDTLDRQDAETILAPIRPRLRLLRLERPLQLSRLLGMPLEPVLIDGPRWRPASAGFPRSALQPLCDVIAGRAPELIAQVHPLTEGASTGDLGRVRAAGKLFWPAAGAALKGATQPPESWHQFGLPASSFAHLAASAAICLTLARRLDALGDPTVNHADREKALNSMLRQAAAAGPMAWATLLVLIFCALPEAQAPRDALLGQGATELRAPAEAALQQIWAWIEAAGVSAPRNLNDAAASLRQRAAVLHALAASRSQRPRAASQQADLRAAYSQYLAEAAHDRLVAPLTDLATGPNDPAMAALEDHARGLRRLLIEIRGVSSAAVDAAPLQDAARAIGSCAAIPLIDRARLLECLGATVAASKLLEKQARR